MSSVEIRRFERQQVRVRDPERPTRTVARTIWAKCNDVTLVHGGKTYDRNPLGWFEVPPKVAEELTKMANWFDRPKSELHDIEVDDIPLNEVSDAPAPRRTRRNPNADPSDS